MEAINGIPRTSGCGRKYCIPECENCALIVTCASCHEEFELAEGYTEDNTAYICPHCLTTVYVCERATGGTTDWLDLDEEPPMSEVGRLIFNEMMDDNLRMAGI